MHLKYHESEVNHHSESCVDESQIGNFRIAFTVLNIKKANNRIILQKHKKLIINLNSRSKQAISYQLQRINL